MLNDSVLLCLWAPVPEDIGAIEVYYYYFIVELSESWFLVIVLVFVRIQYWRQGLPGKFCNCSFFKIVYILFYSQVSWHGMTLFHLENVM